MRNVNSCMVINISRYIGPRAKIHDTTNNVMTIHELMKNIHSKDMKRRENRQ